MVAMAVRSAAMLLALLFQPQACNALATVQRSSPRAVQRARVASRRIGRLLARFLFGWLSPRRRPARLVILWELTSSDAVGATESTRRHRRRAVESAAIAYVFCARGRDRRNRPPREDSTPGTRGARSSRAALSRARLPTSRPSSRRAAPPGRTRRSRRRPAARWPACRSSGPRPRQSQRHKRRRRRRACARRSAPAAAARRR